MKKNESGYTLLGAVIIIMVVMILLGAAISLTSLYHSKSIENNQQKQAYLSAKSMIDVVAEYVIDEENDFIPISAQESIEIESLTLENDATKYGCRIEYVDEKTLEIILSSKYQESEYCMTLTMVKKDNVWTKSSYGEYEGDERP